MGFKPSWASLAQPFVGIHFRSTAAPLEGRKEGALSCGLKVKLPHPLRMPAYAIVLAVLQLAHAAEFKEMSASVLSVLFLSFCPLCSRPFTYRQMATLKPCILADMTPPAPVFHSVCQAVRMIFLACVAFEATSRSFRGLCETRTQVSGLQKGSRGAEPTT